MNWKQFLKPDWRKIIIFVILILIVHFTIGLIPKGKIPYIENLETNECEQYGGRCYGLGDFVYDDCEMHDMISLQYTCPRIFVNTQCCLEIIPPINYLRSFSFIFVSFLISCLIVWVWDNWEKLLKWQRNFSIRMYRAQGYGPISMPVAYRCPRCNSQLRQILDREVILPVYVCRKCGYTGSVFVKPKIKFRK